ncbi:uncharacterized protein [Arachis hypogaea]|uniref:uncharacterized protein n=1 Tax=Arachis hypogaea TaxID=3818 RepID=UPI003B211830
MEGYWAGSLGMLQFRGGGLGFTVAMAARLWTVSHFANSGVKAPIEMVVLDEEGDTIQCSIKGIFVPIIEGLLAEGNVYVFTNFAVALNTIKFKHTRHEFRINFKRDTIVRPVQDSLVPLNGFNFVPLKKIHAESKEGGYLVGVMSVSNTNYNSKLFINVEFPAARDFFARVNKLDPVGRQGIMPLVYDQPVSIEEDFLRLSVYKTIAEIREHNQDAVFVTARTIKEVETEFGWWYTGCKKCRRGLRELEKRYSIPIALKTTGSMYNIHIRVIDHTDAASFVLFDGEAAKFLGVSANDLRQSCVTKGLLSHENSELLSLSTGPYDTSKAYESESTPSPAVDEKHNFKILGAKKHMEEVGEESVSSKSKKGK